MGGKKPPPPKASSSSRSIKNTGKGKSAGSTGNANTANSKSSPRPDTRPDLSASAKEPTAEERQRQQRLLDVFSRAFRDVLADGDAFAARLQELKAALYNRDFAGAFQSGEEALDVYAARWSPTRALGYGRILRGLDGYLRELFLLAIDEDVNDVSALQAGGFVREQGPESVDRGESTIGADGGANDGSKGEEGEPQKESAVANQNSKPRAQTLKVLAIGGAAAEIAAVADYVSSLGAVEADKPTTTASRRRRADITLLDVGPWATMVNKLHGCLTTPPPVPKYFSAEAAAREADKRTALVPPSDLTSTFVQQDILALDEKGLAQLLSTSNPLPDETSSPQPQYQNTTSTKPPKPLLITLLFTLNELYTAGGIKQTTALLRLVTRVASPGTLLLVVDSPGSYSEAAVGKEAKRYPMQWLLDHTLVPPAAASRAPTASKSSPGVQERAVGTAEDSAVSERGGRSETAITDRKPENRWERLESNDSVWFRIADDLRYPIPLENMRYQMHLYRLSAGP